MNVIDLEILIPASPEFIWRFLGDPAALPQWQEDVASVSFLSTQRDGQGTRWRASSDKSNDVVVEVSAWYDTLGYEYQLMDGTKFAENQGRIRLHEVADGTLVRWTFQYELSGVLGGLRNAMSLKRGTTNQLQASLRNLHQLILQESGGISTHEAKASVREAPDVGDRLAYQPRHPTAFHEPALDELPVDEAETATDKQPVAYDEFDAEPVPVIADTDTKPNPVIISVSDAEQLLVAPEAAPDDTKPIPVSPPVIAAPLIRAPGPPEPAFVPERREVSAAASLEPLAPPAAPARADAPRDSAHLSVFEVFGLRKPSEKSPRESHPELPRPAEPNAGAPLLYARHDEAEPVPRPKAQPQTAESSARFGKITGWRRQSRRRMTTLRSHN